MITTPPASGAFRTGTSAATRLFAGAIERHPILAPSIIYVLFAALVYVLQGSEPPLSIDHISYFKLADEILAQFRPGEYWKTFNSVRAYGVILAYLYHLTGSHLTSLKLLLAVMTVAYLWSFHGFMTLLTPPRPRAVLFAVLSALFVTFGASIWGMTDFSASLNRTIIIPFVVLLVWFFFRFFGSPWRYAIFPALIALSLLHLSALHVFLVFGVFEFLDYVFRRRLRFTRDLLYFFVALLASIATQGLVEYVSFGATEYVRYTLAMAVPSLAEKLPSPSPEQLEKLAPKPAPKPPPKPAEASPPIATVPAAPPPKLTNKEAWAIELQAFPWRNFPPSLATVATILSSFGVILLLAVAGVATVWRRRQAQVLDRQMIKFAFAALVAAYGLQVTLWLLRDHTAVLPINFEEIRAINLIMIPAVYYVFRLYDLAPPLAGASVATVRALVVIAFVLQPIVVLRALPASWREHLLSQAVARGIVKSSDAPRMLYARQFLGLAGDGQRFYYSSRPALDWLEHNVGPEDKVLTNLNEFYGSHVKIVGPFLNIVTMDVWDVRRAEWASTLDAIDNAMAAHDLQAVEKLARQLGATYAVVNWPVQDAVYHDENYSIIRVPPQGSQ